MAPDDEPKAANELPGRARSNHLEIVVLLAVVLTTTSLFTTVGYLVLSTFLSSGVALAVAIPLSIILCFVVHNGQDYKEAAIQCGIFAFVCAVYIVIIERPRQERLKQHSELRPRADARK